MLVNFKVISHEERKSLKIRYSNGFHVHGVIKDIMHDMEVKNRLCQYMLRGLIGEHNILYYNKKKQFVVIRYKYDDKYKTLSLKVDEFIARVMQHISSGVIYTRYYGIYSNTLRHKWRAEGKRPNKEAQGVARKDFKVSWRKLIWQVYEIDPLICIKCGTEMELRFIYDKDSAKGELKWLSVMSSANSEVHFH